MIRGENGPIRVVVRYDDCSARSSLDLERRFVDAFDRRGVQATLGVIPEVVEGAFRDRRPQRQISLTPEKAVWLRAAAAAGSAEIALHGFAHQLASGGGLTEFSGLSFFEQQTRLFNGKAELESLLATSVTTFIPPWNSYDGSTLRALQTAGFTCLSASVRGPFDLPTGLRLLPATCRFDAVPRLVRLARRLRVSNPVIVVMMHDFDFFESGSRDAWLGVDAFSRAIDRLSREPDVRIRSLRQACEEGVAPTTAALAAHQAWWMHIQRVPWRFRRLLENQILGDARGPAWRQVFARQARVSADCLAADLIPALQRRLGLGHAPQWTSA